LENKFKYQQEQVTQLSKLKNDVTDIKKYCKHYSIEIDSINKQIRNTEDKLHD
jgi:hypothetical protein